MEEHPIEYAGISTEEETSVSIGSFDVVEEASEITKVASIAEELSQKPRDAAEASSEEREPGKKTDKPVVLIVHASVGSGHKSAAQAIAKAFEIIEREQSDSTLGAADDADPSATADPSGKLLGNGADLSDLQKSYDVRILDILDFGRIKFDGDTTASAFTGASRPFYDLTWRFTLTGRLLWGGGSGFCHVMFPKFAEYVKETQPVAIIATHIIAANCAVSARMILREEYPVLCVPTDYEVEGLWPHLYADLFCVADQHMSETLRARKVQDSRMRITGIPVSPEFSRQFDREEVCARFGLDPGRQIALFLAGATLPRPYIHFRKTIDQLLPYMHTYDDMQIAIVAGKDAEYAERMRREVAERGLENVVILDFVDEMAALMSAADIIVCKSGGLTVTECLCVETPMILVGRAYGQEKANVTMLTSSGSSFHVTTYRELRDLLHQINRHPQITKAIQVNASLIKKPNAALDIANAAIELAHRKREILDPLLKKHFARLYWGHRPAHVR